MKRSYYCADKKENAKRAFVIFTLLIVMVCVCDSPPVYAQAKLYSQRIKYLTSIKDAGSEIHIRQPRDAYIDTRDDVYLLDSGMKNVLIYNKDFTYLSGIIVSSDTAAPQCLCVDHEGYIYVGTIGDKAHMRFGKILKFNTLGRLVEETEFKECESFNQAGISDFAVLDMEIDLQKNLYLAGGKHGAVILDAQKRIIKQIRPQEVKKDPKTEQETSVYSPVTHIAIDSQNRVYLLSKDADRCYVYTDEGDLLFKFGKASGTAGGFSFPHGLCVDETHKMILVMDYMRHTLSFFSMKDGDFMGEFGGLGSGPGWFNYPGSICMNKDNSRLCVADILNKRFQFFDITE